MGSEEKHPRSSPKSLAPPRPGQDDSQVKPAETEVTPNVSPAQAKTSPVTPALVHGTSPEPQGVVVPAVADSNAPTMDQNVQGVPTSW